MRKNRFRNFFIAVLLIAVLLMSTLVVSARDTNKFKTLPKNKWSKTASYCFYRYSKKQKGYIYTYYRIKVPYDSVLTFKMKGQKKNDPVYGCYAVRRCSSAGGPVSDPADQQTGKHVHIKCTIFCAGQCDR